MAEQTTDRARAQRTPGPVTERTAASVGRQMRGRVALVTGAGRGIGAATARRLHDLGAAVVLMDLHAEPAEAMSASLGDDRSRVVTGDVSEPADVERAVEQAVRGFGRLDVLVNNAAVGSAGRVEDLEPDDWKRVMDVSLGGVLNGMKYAVPAMRGTGGSIINVSSVAARHALYAMTAYAAAKAAVEAATRCAAIELRDDAIRVNAVAPGMIRSHAAEASIPILDRAIPPSFDSFITHRQGRWGEPSEIAAVIAHLAGDEASFVTGQTYTIDHGASLLL